MRLRYERDWWIGRSVNRFSPPTRATRKKPPRLLRIHPSYPLRGRRGNLPSYSSKARERRGGQTSASAVCPGWSLCAPYMIVVKTIPCFKFCFMKLMNKKSHIDYRKSLRNNATISEKRLWKLLNKKQQTFKFRRQHGIGPFIVDFYLPLKKLAIEIDGSIHDNVMRKAYDQNREDYLFSKGVKIIRFTNEEIQYNIDDVIRKIMFACGVE